MARPMVYLWLSQQLDIPYTYCHVGMFDMRTCREVVNLCEDYRTKIVTAELASTGVDWSDLA